MANAINMLQTYYRKSRLPEGLQADCEFELKAEIVNMKDAILSRDYQHRRIILHGASAGKTTSAAELLKAWLQTRSDVVDYGLPGFFLSIHQLCYQNRCVDRYARDAGLEATIQDACRADFLIMDGLFPYLTQNDDLLLQAIYDQRQHANKTTIVTTGILDPLDCASSLAFRMFRDADMIIKFEPAKKSGIKKEGETDANEVTR